MEPAVTKAVLLVGGEGTRLRPLTNRRPKALLPLLNRPLLSYELELLVRHGIRDIVLAVGYKADALREELGDGGAWGARLTYVEDPTPLGTAGAIKNVERLLDGPFVAMNGDLVYDVDLAAVVRAHLQARATITFCLRVVSDISRYGLIQRDAGGWVAAFKEKQAVDETGGNAVNSGLYVMSPEVLGHIPAGREYSNETGLFPGLLAAGKRLLGFVPPRQGYWADVGTLEAYHQATAELLRGAVAWTGPAVHPSLSAGPGVQITHPVHIAEGVTLGAGALIGPNVALGPGSHVGAGSRLRDTIVWRNVRVGSRCCLENTVIADGTVVADGVQNTEGVVLQ